MTQRTGINPHRWFYSFRDFLEPRRLATVLAGSAAEQWLNAEFFRYLAGDLSGSGDLTVYPEWGKRDLALMEVVDGRPITSEAAAIIEAKVVYSSYEPGKIDTYVKTLLKQVSSAARNEGCPAFGLLFAVYGYWPGVRRRPPRRTMQEFRRLVGSTLDGAMRRYPRLKRGKYAMETFLPERRICVGATHAVVGVAAQYVFDRGR